MNILDARKLQKKLYKESICDFKRMRTQNCDGKLYYDVLHQLSKYSSVILTKDNLGRMGQALSNNIEIHMGYVSKNNVNNIPEGFYIVEIIVIDD